MSLLAVGIFVGAYALIATDRIHRATVALVGAALMLATRILSTEEAFHSLEFGVDWAVIFLLLGMMLIVAVLWRTGLFDYIAIWSAKKARGRPYRIMVILCTVTAFASALLDNVTTVLLVAPVTILITERLAVSPVPYLIAEVLASNIGGTATLVGDPPNIIIASAAGLSYTSFITNLGPVVILILVVFLFLAKILFRRELEPHPEKVAEILALDEREAIRDQRLLVRALAVLILATLGFLFHRGLGYEPAAIALLAGGGLLLLSGTDRGELLRDVEWETLAFFLGLFVMVGGLVKVGVIESIAGRASKAAGGDLLLASMLVLFVSGILSALVDNIPYVAAMAPVVGELTADLGAGGTNGVLWWALALGADLGGNATAVGASANVIVIGLAARAGYPIRFFEFLKYGGLVTAVSLVISAAYLWIRYFALP